MTIAARAGLAVTCAVVVVLGVGACGDPDEPAAVTVELRTAHEEYRTPSPPMLTLAVDNGADHACAIPRHGIGSLTVVSVERDGVDVPSASRAIPTFAPAVDAVRAALVDLAPGDAQALDVEVASGPDGASRATPAIVSHVVARSGGMTQTRWPVADRGRYRVTAALRIPTSAARTDRAPLCTPSGAASVEFTVT